MWIFRNLILHYIGTLNLMVYIMKGDPHLVEYLWLRDGLIYLV